MSECEAFGLSNEEAAKAVMRIIEGANSWQDHFAQLGVCYEGIESLALRTDDDFLKSQRDSFDTSTYQV